MDDHDRRPQKARLFGAGRRSLPGQRRWFSHIKIHDFTLFDGAGRNAKLAVVDVVLRKLGKGSRAVAGRLVRAPRKGSVVVIEFPDGMHEYVTTPVKRVLRLAGREVFYIETINSRYRLEVRGREDAVAESAG